MSEEIERPNSQPKLERQGFSPLGSFLAAAGVTLLIMSMLGAAMVATIWAACKLFGLPDMFMYVLQAAGGIPVIWATIWTAGRAWHVERRLAQELDIDVPVFKMMHYYRKG